MKYIVGYIVLLVSLKEIEISRIPVLYDLPFQSLKQQVTLFNF